MEYAAAADVDKVQYLQGQKNTLGGLHVQVKDKVKEIS
jgi:hypothetical protein